MKRITFLGLGVVAIALALGIPTLGGSGVGASPPGEVVAASDPAAGLGTVGQGHPAMLLGVTAIGVLALGLVAVVGVGRRRA